MWCSMFSFITIALAPHVSSVDVELLELAHQQVDDVVLLVPLEDDVLGLGCAFSAG